ncbi:hypothetical protein Val02_03790 [Virgisporangium aliadipatigenens]|uniref:Uncharacterized protein n=1 Tax=Virgisporangium aliadipatigenens TaxID=741659 RepID=A0A8J3YGC1_9ACTN|nr:hypothetical protein [Virgisporangium aliadipatigenens]GIJ43493.1 hypothetical protein Val02_03790 [Virgisporangium aliadipatigenens]
MGVGARAAGGFTAIAGWVHDSAVPAFVASLAALAGRTFDDADHAALDKELAATDADDPDTWASVALAGDVQLTVELAVVRGTGTTLAQVWFPDDGELRERVDALLSHGHP